MSERKELQPVEVVRDAEGYWTHPDLEELLKTANEEFATAAEWNAFKQQQNIETRNISFDGDDGNGDPDISSWNPAKPEGHGWFMLSLHDTEDGALCIWARKSQFLVSPEQEKFEKSIAARMHPARFTKVGENPMLGWNGAKDSDYVNPEMQQHWNTWQAATAQAVPEGYVVVPKKPTKNMINQGYEAHDGFFTNGAVVGVWEAMIKAAQDNDNKLWAVNIPEEPDSEELLFAAISKEHAQSIVSRLHNEIFETYPTFGEPIADSIYVTEWQGSAEEHAESLATKWWEHTTFLECE